jgi:hypothetical protein
LAAGTIAASVVLLVKLVFRADPFSSTVEPLLKPVPVTVRVVSLDPLATTEGEIAVSVGAAEYGFPVMVRVEAA